ncbi:MAG: DUF4132 domain-containing protein [Paracoccaceae bacterium]
MFAHPFVALDKLGRGLGKRANAFYETGEDRSVLAEIEAAYVSTNTQRAVFQEYQTCTHPLKNEQGGQPDRLARLFELHLTFGLPANHFRAHIKHHEEVPEKIRAFFVMINNVRRVESSENPTRMEDVIGAVKLLGGSEADVVTFMLPCTGYAPRFYIPEPGFETRYVHRLPVDALIVALERCDTKNRVNAIQNFRAEAAEKTPKFIDYLFSQLDGSSAKLRDIVRSRLKTYEASDVESRALALLDAKKATTRTAIVQILGDVGTPTATEALRERRTVEKTQSVLTALDVYLTLPAEASAVTSATLSGSYVNVHGKEITAQDVEPLTDDGRSPLGSDFLEHLKQVEDEINKAEVEQHETRMDYWRKSAQKYEPPKKPEPVKFADYWMKRLNAPMEPSDTERSAFIYSRYQSKVHAALSSVLDQLPLRRVVDFANKQSRAAFSVTNPDRNAFSEFVYDKLQDGDLKLPQVINVGLEKVVPSEEKTIAEAKADYIGRFVDATIVSHANSYRAPGPLPTDFWAVAMGRLDRIAEKLPPINTDAKTIEAALKICANFPDLPQALLQPVLFAAIEGKPSLQKKAQDLLLDAPGIDDLLISMIADNRQAVRANAARFLASRGAKEAVPALVKRLKTEKSELARADLISAISNLGGDTDPYLGKSALLAEAAKLADKLPADKIDWLDMNTAPALVWADGSSADPVLLDAWLRLALKLKSPLGSPLFSLYMQQLDAECAASVSDWVLESWIAYDAFAPASEAKRQEAERRADAVLANPNHWAVKVGYNRENLVNDFMRSLNSGYVNSGSDSKGILALTHSATPSTAGPRIAAYLKSHGRRVSQAKALVETLFGMGSKDAVQVLVATATRFKQRTVRELAETLVAELAEARGWTQDALADRSVPTGGFEDSGILPLPIEEEGKDYSARLGDDLTVQLLNPDGKVVKSLPAGKDENTKDSKAALSAAKKTMKTVKAQQEARLYEAMLTPRVWSAEDWRNDLTTHPILKRLIERIIWRGMDKGGNHVATLRPTPEGEYLDAMGDEVDLSAITQIDIAHTANLPEKAVIDWRQHLKDFEVSPLFHQLSRPVQTLAEEKKAQTEIDDRKGWVTTNYKLRSAAKKAGYERGPIEDSGGYYIYRKEFRKAGLWADLRFTGSYVAAEEDHDIAIEHVQFSQINSQGFGRATALGKVPPLLLSEVWNDMHEIAKSGAFDPEWKTKSYY